MTRRRCNPACDCADAFTWLRDNGHSLAGLTGQDASALRAIAHAWRMYARSDEAGQRGAMHAICFLLTGMQAKERHLARELIAWAMDWDDRARLWPAQTSAPLLAGEVP